MELGPKNRAGFPDMEQLSRILVIFFGFVFRSLTQYTLCTRESEKRLSVLTSIVCDNTKVLQTPVCVDQFPYQSNRAIN